MCANRPNLLSSIWFFPVACHGALGTLRYNDVCTYLFKLFTFSLGFELPFLSLFSFNRRIAMVSTEKNWFSKCADQREYNGNGQHPEKSSISMALSQWKYVDVFSSGVCIVGNTHTLSFDTRIEWNDYPMYFSRSSACLFM